MRLMQLSAPGEPLELVTRGGNGPGCRAHAPPRERRLPVVGKGGRLVGLVSTDDLVRVLPGELADIGMIVARGRARETAARR